MEEITEAMFKAMEFEARYFEDMTLQQWKESVLKTLYDWGNVSPVTIENVKFYALEAEEDSPVTGQYDPEAKTISLRDRCDGVVLLHEMIHHYEHSLRRLNPALCELLTVQLWDKLKERIGDLEERALRFLEIVEHNGLEASGGEHGLLFLLKSYDLDIRLGLPLGTVMGYGHAEEYN